MMLRKFLVFAIGMMLAGCGSSGPSIAGTWEGGFKGVPLTLTAQPDGSFQIKGSTSMVGRWEVSGKGVKLFRDIRNGGDVGFGDGSDGAMNFTLSADAKRMEGKAADGASFSFTKK